MTPERWQRLKPLYNAALDLPVQDRQGFVDQLCAEDRDLGNELGTLLRSHDLSADMLDTPVGHLSSLFTAAPSILLPGDRLAGRFRIVRHLGSGGMGDVYEALDEQMGQSRIALKTVRPSLAANPAALARFKDEVRLARQVSGPNVCRIHELYVVGPEDSCNCTAFLTMEMLEGITLHERIAQLGPQHGAQPATPPGIPPGTPSGTQHIALQLPEMRRIAEQLCTALCCIHHSGIVHGDLKPRNVMLVPSGNTERVVVTDFGLARAVAGSASGPGETSLVAGTPAYMAPEQFEGRDLTPATDVYALGVMLYEMATGVQPYAAHTPLAAAIRRSKAPVHASAVRTDLPAGWDDVIARCLRYEPEQRFQSAEEVEHQLRHPGKISVRLGRTHRVTLPLPLLWGAAAATAAVLCLAVWLAFFRPHHRELAPDAAHWYELGMTALREGSYLKATRLLTMVTERDPTYALAHAALADAWTELDSTAAAQHEMLLASSPQEQRGLNDQERRYIDAVRSTLIRDYSAAAQDYEAILQGLPSDSKAQGYVDLGRIYEKSGKVNQTVASYEHAAKLNPDDPAPFLHLGILKSRLRKPDEADKAFTKAETLYNAESDQEGLAEVVYQRGYASNDAGRFASAEEYVRHSLAIARQIHSPQLEARSLSQLSTILFRQNRDAEALASTQEVLRLARDEDLEYWIADGYVRLGNVYLHKEDLANAQRALTEALDRAHAGHHPRLEASAEVSLASLCNKQNRSDEQIAYATHALTYFRDYGFMNSADAALTLIAWAQTQRGNYSAALEAGLALRHDAEITHSYPSLAYASELTGVTLLTLQRYPEALPHFQQAADAMTRSGADPAYQQLHLAANLWPLGRYDEAQLALEAISQPMRARTDIGAGIAVIQVEMLGSRGDDRRTLEAIQDVMRRFPSATADDLDLLDLRLVTEARLGRAAEARLHMQQLLTAASRQQSRLAEAQAQLAQGTALNLLGDFAQAHTAAEHAQPTFAANATAESAALTALVLATSARAQGDQAEAVVQGQHCLDIFRQLQQSWGVPAFKQYMTRPDRREIPQRIADLLGQQKASAHAPPS